MAIVRSLILLLLSASVTNAAENWHQTLGVTAHDADTVHCDQVMLDWGVALVNVNVRAAGYDACEVDHTRQTVNVTDAEIATGIKARDGFRDLLKRGRLELGAVDGGKQSVYGRIEAKFRVVMPDGSIVDVGEWCKANGYLRTAN